MSFMLTVILMPISVTLTMLLYVTVVEKLKERKIEKLKTKRFSITEVGSWEVGDMILFVPEAELTRDIEPLVAFLVTAGSEDIVVSAERGVVQRQTCKFLKPWEVVENATSNERKKLAKIVLEAESYSPDFTLPGLEYHENLIPHSHRLTSGRKNYA